MSLGVNTPVLTEAEVGRRMGAAYPEVQFVYCRQDGNVMHVRTFVPNRNLEVYARIIDVEGALIDENPGLIFDAHIWPLFGRAPETLLGEGYRKVFSRAGDVAGSYSSVLRKDLGDSVMAMEIWILCALVITLAALFLVNRIRRRRVKEASDSGGTTGNVYPLW